MKKISFILCALAITFFSCDMAQESESDNGLTNGVLGNPTESYADYAVESNTYYDLTIGSFDYVDFEFIPESDGTYTVSLTNISSDGDLGFVIEDYSTYDEIVEANEYSNNQSETASVNLTAGTVYLIVVDEWNAPGTDVSYRLSITGP